MQNRYGGRVVSTDCLRSTDHVAPFEMRESTPYQRGEDILVDMLLLSRCDFLLKGVSNVGEMAMYFNPQLECKDLSLGKVAAFGESYFRGWHHQSTRPAWKLIGKTDLSRVADNVASRG